MIQLRIVPIQPPAYEMNLMRCQERTPDKKHQCILPKEHFGVHKFEDRKER